MSVRWTRTAGRLTTTIDGVTVWVRKTRNGWAFGVGAWTFWKPVPTQREAKRLAILHAGYGSALRSE